LWASHVIVVTISLISVAFLLYNVALALSPVFHFHAHTHAFSLSLSSLSYLYSLWIRSHTHAKSAKIRNTHTPTRMCSGLCSCVRCQVYPGTNWPMHPEIHRLRQLGIPRDDDVYNRRVSLSPSLVLSLALSRSFSLPPVHLSLPLSFFLSRSRALSLSLALSPFFRALSRARALPPSSSLTASVSLSLSRFVSLVLLSSC